MQIRLYIRTKLKMFCDEDSKALKSPTNIPVTINNQYETSL